MLMYYVVIVWSVDVCQTYGDLKITLNATECLKRLNFCQIRMRLIWKQIKLLT